jgi:hypothetical protein
MLSLVSALSAMTTPALTQCMGKFEDSASYVLPSYDPFSPQDVRVRKYLYVRNLSSQPCRFRVYLARSPAQGSFTNQLRYTVTDEQALSLLTDNASSGTARFLLSSEAPAFGRVSLSFYFDVERGQFATPAAYNDTIDAVLLPEESAGEVDRQSVSLSMAVESVTNVSIAGGGITTTIQFGRLETGKARSLILEAQSNTPYKLTFASAYNGNLRLDPPVLSQTWSIPYQLHVDGTVANLSAERILSGDAPISGKQTHTLTFQIVDATSKRAGIYKDIVTIRISPRT